MYKMSGTIHTAGHTPPTDWAITPIGNESVTQALPVYETSTHEVTRISTDSAVSKPSISGNNEDHSQTHSLHRDVSTQTKIFHKTGEELQRSIQLYNQRRPALSIGAGDDGPVLKVQEKLRDKAKNFCVITSYDGIGHIVLDHKRNPYRWKNKVYFLALVFVMTFNGYYNIMEVITKYFGMSLNKKLRHDSYFDMEFPAVTICNANRIKANHSPPILPPTREYLSGHTLKDMLIKCRFDGEPCNTSDFHWLWSHERGNCYTFNNHKDARGVEVPSRKIDAPGRNSGLELVINVDPKHYDESTDVMGVYTTVHERTKRPNLRIDSVRNSPGYCFLLKIKKENNEGYVSYGRCLQLSQDENKERNFYAGSYSYTSNTCQNTYIQVQAIKEFQCCIMTYPCNPLGMKSMFGVKLEPSYEHCNNSLEKQLVKSAWIKRKRKESKKNCLPECNYSEFKMTTSSFKCHLGHSKDDHRHVIKSSYIKEPTNLPDDTLFLEVFFSTFEVTSFVEEPKYKFIPFFSNIGAMLGVCFGFSLTTALELCEFLFATLGRLFKIYKLNKFTSLSRIKDQNET